MLLFNSEPEPEPELDPVQVAVCGDDGVVSARPPVSDSDFCLYLGEERPGWYYVVASAWPSPKVSVQNHI